MLQYGQARDKETQERSDNGGCGKEGISKIFRTSLMLLPVSLLVYNLNSSSSTFIPGSHSACSVVSISSLSILFISSLLWNLLLLSAL